MTSAAARLRAARATDALTVALLELARQGQRTNCSDPETHHYWTSEHPPERKLAVRACAGCPVLQPCLEVGRHQTFGVFGGVDVTRTPGRPKTAA
jgi:Transcription factor WhiB